MYKTFFLAAIVLLMACNNDTKEAKSVNENGNTQAKSFTWPQEDEQEFMDDCIENTDAKMQEAAAFANCKCVLNELKKTFPNLDSAANALTDTARVAAFTAKCK
jgi:major membrane immunogen (membrane-anchored lipoprotein)